MKTFGTADDPKGLIKEAYNIDGITKSECRTIFLDWALSLPDGQDAQTVIPQLLARHGQEDHPMSEVMREGMAARPATRRRGGWRARAR